MTNPKACKIVSVLIQKFGDKTTEELWLSHASQGLIMKVNLICTAIKL